MTVEKLWAPWRMQYIEQLSDEQCIFCTKSQDSNDHGNYILHRGAHAFIMLNAFPYNNGHLLVAPYRHVAELEELNQPESSDLMKCTQLGVQALKSSFRPDGFNIGLNLGRTAGAGIASHLHLHIVPRWNGDTNFMPVIANTKVLPEALRETYRKLCESLAQILGAK